MKTMMTANSVHLSWWKLARIVLSIRGSFFGAGDYSSRRPERVAGARLCYKKTG
jgi:hypothetical protein